MAQLPVINLQEGIEDHICQPAGEISLQINGIHNAGDTISETFTLRSYDTEEIEHSNSIRINKQDSSDSSVNIIRFNDKQKSASIYISFFFDGQSYRDPFIQVETRKKVDKYRTLISYYFLDTTSNGFKENPIFDLIYDEVRKEISGKFIFNPSGHEQIAITGNFCCYLNKFLFESSVLLPF